MENSIIQNIDQKMVKTIDALKKDFVSIKAGRANPNILEIFLVDYYGSVCLSINSQKLPQYSQLNL